MESILNIKHNSTYVNACMQSMSVIACMQSRLTGSPICFPSRIWADDINFSMYKCICQNIFVFIVISNLINLQNIHSKNLIFGIIRAPYTTSIHMRL